MSRARIIGFSALALCILGYGASIATFALYRLDRIDLSQMLWIGGPAAILGEIGLWSAAACLGWTIFKRRRAILDRVFRRTPRAV
jgi:hypothetical protein